MTKIKVVAGIKYILGENDKENHEIIKDSDSNYWWFHLDNYASGHCIVCIENINDNIKIIAGNYLKKYSKLKKNNKIKICYTQIKNLKILNTPGLVEYNKNINFFDCYSTKIYHYSKYKNGYAKEYIIPGGNINITNNGIGSGVYGTTKKQNKQEEYVFNLENPYILNDDDKCRSYINASLLLNKKLNDLENNTLQNISKLFL